MNIALIGYGKMGREIEKTALERGHTVSLTIDINNTEEFTSENLKNSDVAIEFTNPGAAVNNYFKCFDAGIPVVSGTTGWTDKMDMVSEKCREINGTFFYASNFSIGVNLFFELNRKLATMMAAHREYEVDMKEIHHVHKLDAPSGTAIKLAEDIIRIIPNKTGWVNKPSEEAGQLPICSERTGEVPGIHTVKYESDVDYIEITHSAKSRKGFALGSILAAEFCQGRRGIFSMKDLLNI